jgi:hypothetical protein
MANLPQVSTTPAISVAKFTAGVVDTGGKFPPVSLIPVVHLVCVVPLSPYFSIFPSVDHITKTAMDGINRRQLYYHICTCLGDLHGSLLLFDTSQSNGLIFFLSLRSEH